MEDFCHTHLPTILLEKMDLNTLQWENYSFIDETFKSTEADVVYSIRIGTTLAYLYILCEQQTEIDRIYGVSFVGLHHPSHGTAPRPAS